MGMSLALSSIRLDPLYNNIANIFGGASLFLPLTHSLVPNRGTGSPTFTRATTGTVSDNEGILRTAIAGEARFTGARRVRNLILGSSENLTASPWVANGAPTIAANSVTFVATSSNGARNPSITAAVTLAQVFIIRAKVWTDSGTKQFRLQITKPTVANYASGDLTATTTPTVFSYIATTAAGSSSTDAYIINSSDASVGKINVSEVMVEDITGRADQTTPSEYVSVGVLSAPYHGTGVDGVKCFDTDLSGNPIAASTLKGYLAEAAATNLALSSEDQSNASYWTVFQTTALANQAIGSDGAMSMTKITEVAVTNFHLVRTINIATAINTTYTGTIDLKQGTQRYATLLLWGVTSSTNREIYTVDLSNGTISTAGGVPTNCTVEARANGVYRCRITGTTSGTDVNVNFYVYLSNDGTNAPSYAGDTGKYIYTGKAQLELGSAATSYIPTTTIAVTRNADVLTYPSSGNISNASGTVIISAQFNSTAGSGTMVAKDNTSIILYTTSNLTEVRSYDGTTVIIGTGGASLANTQRKVGVNWSGTARNVWAAGAVKTSGTFDTTWTAGDIAVGCYNTGSTQWNGNLKGLYIFNRQLSDSEMTAILRA